MIGRLPSALPRFGVAPRADRAEHQLAKAAVVALRCGRLPVIGGAVAVTTAQIKAHLYLHAVLPQLEEVVRIDPEAAAWVAGRRGTIQLRVAGGPVARLELAEGRLQAHRRGRMLPSLGLVLLGAQAAVALFEGGKAPPPLPWIGVWRPGLIAGLRTLGQRLQYYLATERKQLEADDRFAPAVAVRLAVLAYAIQVLAETWDTARRIAATAAIDGVVSIGLDGHPPVQLSSVRGRLQVARGEVQPPNLTVRFTDAASGFGVLSGSLDLWTALGTGAVRLRGHLLLLDPILQIMGHVGSFLTVGQGTSR